MAVVKQYLNGKLSLSSPWPGNLNLKILIVKFTIPIIREGYVLEILMF